MRTLRQRRNNFNCSGNGGNSALRKYTSVTSNDVGSAFDVVPVAILHHIQHCICISFGQNCDTLYK